MTVTPILSYSFQEWLVLLRTAELFGLKFKPIQNSDYCNDCLVFLLLVADTATNDYRLHPMDDSSAAESWKSFCCNRKIFLSFEGSLLHNCSNGFCNLGLQQWAVVSSLALGKRVWKSLSEWLWGHWVKAPRLVHSSSEFSANPVLFGLTETSTFCKMLFRASVGVVLLCPQVL